MTELINNKALNALMRDVASMPGGPYYRAAIVTIEGVLARLESAEAALEGAMPLLQDGYALKIARLHFNAVKTREIT